MAGSVEIASIGVRSIAVSAVFAEVGGIVIAVVMMGAVPFAGAVPYQFRW